MGGFAVRWCPSALTAGARVPDRGDVHAGDDQESVLAHPEVLAVHSETLWER